MGTSTNYWKCVLLYFLSNGLAITNGVFNRPIMVRNQIRVCSWGSRGPFLESPDNINGPGKLLPFTLKVEVSIGLPLP